MICSIWSGAMWRIYVGFPNRNKHFLKKFKDDVEIEIDDKLCKVQLAPSFWSTCPEIRVARDRFGRNYLYEWIKKNNLMPPSNSRQMKDKVVLEVVEPYKKFKLYVYR